MAKTFSLDYEALHYDRVGLTTKKVDQLYQSAIREATAITNSINFDSSKPFSFSDYPTTKKRIDKVINNLSNHMSVVIGEATKEEWISACVKNDELIERLLKTTKLLPKDIRSYGNRNLEALSAFQNRKINGLGLSDKVWNYSNQFKGDLEMALDLGIGDGRSAAQMSRDIRSYLNEPSKLFRRVRDKHGVLQLSKNAKKYSPGSGVYRSSYKNAMRLTITETNMAYRASDYERFQQEDFIVGFEVVRSNHVFGCPVCESLKGKYPKTFKFVGWHPHCRCHVISILATQQEFIDHQKKLMAGEESTLNSKNEISKLPTNFNKWVEDNKDRIALSKSQPYFLKDNAALIKNVKKEPYVYSEKSFDKLKELGVKIRTEQVAPYSYQKNMGEFNLTEFNDELISICQKNNISLSEFYLIQDFGEMKLAAYGYYKGDVLKPFTLERKFRRSDGIITVNHTKLVIPDELQGKGMSKELFRTLYKQYQNGGIERIKVHANMEIGGYTWGRYGFKMDEYKIREFVENTFKDVDIRKEVKNFVSDYFHVNPNAQSFPMDIICQEKYKKHLIGSEWYGSIDLKEDLQRTVFERYMNYKKQ